LAELGQRIRADYTAEHETWLQKLVVDLARDGLLLVTEQGVRLPD
jgi:A/G-specific adenine glycosylase